MSQGKDPVELAYTESLLYEAATSSPANILCSQCSARPSSPRTLNLVVVLDGTANQFGLYNSNCVELYSHLEKTSAQRTYYNSGIGTYINPRTHSSYKQYKHRLLNAWDMMTAYRLKAYIIGAYRWLSNQDSPGCRIFLFGFSRGAYEVRALASMIHKVGLIHTGNEEQIEFAYQLFADPGSDTLAATFKKTFSRDVGPVHFVGVWDTVSSVGLLRNRVLPGVSDTANISIIRHAVSLDERRVKFLPELYYATESRTIPNVKEVWFAGCHSDVGGGNRINADLLLGDVPLIWMEWEAMQAGLHLCVKVPAIWNFDALPKQGKIESLQGLYWLMEFRHRGRGREIPLIYKLHTSTLFKVSKIAYEGRYRELHLGDRNFSPDFDKYTPAAHPPPPLSWKYLKDRIDTAELTGFDVQPNDAFEADLFDDSDSNLISLAHNMSCIESHATLRSVSAARLVFLLSHSVKARCFLADQAMAKLLMEWIDARAKGDRLDKAALRALWYLAIHDKARPFLISAASFEMISRWLLHPGTHMQWAGVSILREVMQVNPRIRGPLHLKGSVTTIPYPLSGDIVRCLQSTTDESVQKHAINVISSWIHIAGVLGRMCEAGLLKALIRVATAGGAGQSRAISVLFLLVTEGLVEMDAADLPTLYDFGTAVIPLSDLDERRRDQLRSILAIVGLQRNGGTCEKTTAVLSCKQ